jgi:hypothetical protein
MNQSNNSQLINLSLSGLHKYGILKECYGFEVKL